MSTAAAPAARAGGLRRTAWAGVKVGLPIAVVATVGALLLGEEASELVWGATLILGPVFLLVGVAFWAIDRGVMRLDARWSVDEAVKDPYPFMLRNERVLVRIGLALALTWLVLSAALLLRGETLF